MKSVIKPVCCFCLACLTIFCGCTQLPGKTSNCQTGYQRIISLVPSITETLFALGAGERVVGTSRFSTFPPQAASLPKVGGFTDPNYELILRLKPDLVIGMKEQHDMAGFCKKMHITFCGIDNHNLPAILESFAIIGKICNKELQADSLIKTITVLVRSSGSDFAKPVRILLCAGRDNAGSKSIASVFAAGPRTFYEDLIRASGAVNVVKDSTFDYPRISLEGIARVRPDIIIDILDPLSNLSESVAALDWEFLKKLCNNPDMKIVVIKRDYASIPGPRVSLVLSDFKNLVTRYQKHAL